MAKDEAFRRAERTIEEAAHTGAIALLLIGMGLTELPDSICQLTNLRKLDLEANDLTALPESLGQLTNLQSLDLSINNLTVLPEWIGELTDLQLLCLHNNKLPTLPRSIGQLSNLQSLALHGNQLTALPESLGQLANLRALNLRSNRLTALPEPMGQLAALHSLDLRNNRLTALPGSLGQLTNLYSLDLASNPLNKELKAAYAEGLDAVRRFLRATAKAQVVLNEAKLILVGEGEVGKSCLLAALRGDPWEEGKPTTHGIEIKPVDVVDPDSGTTITLNGWDFGGQRVYRPTHQLFFSAPAVYLVVWKPREGPQQGFVHEWIKLVKHREPDAKILVVATHGGAKERQPDIDRQQVWDVFDKDTVVDFVSVESKPDEATGNREGVAELKDAIARVAASLPEVGRKVPRGWEEAQAALEESDMAYLPLDEVLDLCRNHDMEDEEAGNLIRISHRLGRLIHYQHDPILRDIVILRPDWLAKAISFVLDDKETRETRGLVTFEHLSELWSDPAREEEDRYPADLHPVFRRLMERFDLSYRVAEPHEAAEDGTSLIAQLVSDVRPEADLAREWPGEAGRGDGQQVQVCRIVDAKNGQSAPAEGLFYQLIVRLHKHSLGRVDHRRSVHWQRGLVLDNGYNGRALLEHVGNDVRITVRAAYPQFFLGVLTNEVKWLVDSFWEGLRCDVTVPCIEPCGRGKPGTALFDVEKLIDSKKKGRAEYPCPVCNEWQNIDALLTNAPAARQIPVHGLVRSLEAELRAASLERANLHRLLVTHHEDGVERFDGLDLGVQRVLSKVDDAFSGLMRTLTDEAKEGPRLFSFEPVDPGFFDRPKWVSEKFRLTLWCEHSRLPLPVWNEDGDTSGVYELTIPRKWFVKAAPVLKLIGGTLSLVAPVAASATKLALSDEAFKGIEKQLDLGQKCLDAVVKGGAKAGAWLGHDDDLDVEPGGLREAKGGELRQLQVWLKEKDPSLGGLVRVQNRRHEFLWVHPRFEGEY